MPERTNLAAGHRETLYAAFVARRRWIDVGAYAPQDDTLDCHAAVTAALAEGDGREIVFTAPFGARRVYRFLTRASGRLLMPRRGRIIWEPGASCDFSAWGRTGTAAPYFEATGTFGTARTVSAALAKGTRTILLTSGGADFAVGALAYLASNQFFTQEDGSLGTKGEWVRIAARSGNTITVACGVRDDYPVAGQTVTLSAAADLVSLTIENPQIIGAGKRTAAGELGDRAIRIISGQNCNVIGGDIRNADFMGVMFASVCGGAIRGVTGGHEPLAEEDRNQYGIAIANACEDITVAEIDWTGGKEGIVLTVSGDQPGVSRGIDVVDNRVRGTWRSGVCTHDNHLGLRIARNRIEDCEQGIDIRITDARVEHNVIVGTGKADGTLDCGVQLGSGAGRVDLIGNRYEDCLRGIWMPGNASPNYAIDHEIAPGDIVIDGDIVRSARASAGVLLAFKGSARAPNNAQLGKLSIRNVDFDLSPSLAANGVQARGRWTDVEVHGTFRGGNGGGAAVFLTRPNDDAATTNGPINPMIDITYGSGFTNPVVQYATGVTKTKLRGIGFLASGET